jgi:transposase InsO family protein
MSLLDRAVRHPAGAHDRERHAFRGDHALDGESVQGTLAELSVRDIRTQIDTPWTNGKIEAFWAILQTEVLDRQHLADLVSAEVAVIAHAGSRST